MERLTHVIHGILSLEVLMNIQEPFIDSSMEPREEGQGSEMRESLPGRQNGSEV